MAKAELKWYGEIAKEIAKEAAQQAILKCGADLQRKSSSQAPIDTGDLRANCSVSPFKQKGKKIYVTVGYDLPYARRQHEHLEYRHPKGGKAKYLEDPFNENKSRYESIIKAAVKQGLARGD